MPAENIKKRYVCISILGMAQTLVLGTNSFPLINSFHTTLLLSCVHIYLCWMNLFANIVISFFRYWKLSLMVHPDKSSHPQAHQAFVKLNKAFKDLQDPDKVSFAKCYCFVLTLKMLFCLLLCLWINKLMHWAIWKFFGIGFGRKHFIFMKHYRNREFHSGIYESKTSSVLVLTILLVITKTIIFK